MARYGVISFLLIISLLFSCAYAEGFNPLAMDEPDIAPAPLDENYLSSHEYRDESISVVLTEGNKGDVHYTCAHIKISHPSQLRAVPANMVYQPNAVFSGWDSNSALSASIAQAANAVVAINGDFYTVADKCQVVMRQCRQVRNYGDGRFDVLIIDNEGNFSAIPQCKNTDYLAYYDEHSAEMYQAFCFGPVLVENGKSIIDENFDNGYFIAKYKTQRVAIAQVDALEYMIIVCDGDAQQYTFGMTVYEFAQLCEEIGYTVRPEGFKMAYNLDGGNSASLVFKRQNDQGVLTYQKINMPERERTLADMICFVSLVGNDE